MKRFILLLLFLIMPHLARAQVNLSAAGTDCSISNSCLTVAVGANTGGVTFSITSNASSNTIQFEAAADGINGAPPTLWVALNVTPSNGTTAVTSTTSTGVWQANVSAYTNVRMRMSTLAGGTTTVLIRQSTASARSGGGGSVTHSAGNLTAGNVVIGNGAADVKVDSACVTNGTGALSGCTSISAGSGASAAGATATGGFACVEGASTGWTPTAGQDYQRCDSTLHTMVKSDNGAAETPIVPPGTTVSGSNITFPGSVKATGIPLTVANDGTGDYNATGVADQVPIQAAITAASAAGGGTVFIKQGTYHLTACVTPVSNVAIWGVQPGLTGFDGQSDDYWTISGNGTILLGDNAEVGFCFNNTPSSNPAAYATSNSLSHAEFRNFGMMNFTRAFDIGSQDNPGCYWCVIKNIYVSTNTQWGLHFENFSESYFEQIHSVSNTVGDMWFGSTVNNANYQPGNSEFHQLYASPLNNLARGIVFAAPGGESNSISILNSIKVFNAQVNRFRDTLTQQTITPANASTSISVTDLTQFAVGMPFWVTTTADGYTLNLMYFVLTVSGSSGAGTITAGTSAAAAAAITANNNTALTMRSYGFAALEVAGSSSTASPSTVNANIQGMDLEGSASMGFYDERGANSTYQFSSMAVSLGPSIFVFRSSTNPTIISDSGLTADIDSNSGTVLWNGARSTMLQRNPAGIYKDTVISAYGLALTNPTGNNPDIYVRAPGGNFLYPSIGIGEAHFTRDTTFTLTANFCGVVTFNGAASQTFTLPVVDNAATKNASYQGVRYKIVNASQTNTLAVATQSSQTFNNVASLTSITVPVNSVLEVTASTTGAGGILYWAAIFETLDPSTLTNCSSSASPAVCGSAKTGAIAIPTGVTPTLTVNTTGVNAKSRILFTPDESLGTDLGITCNSTIAQVAIEPVVSARVAGTSFTITYNTTVTVNAVCLSYFIVD